MAKRNPAATAPKTTTKAPAKAPAKVADVAETPEVETPDAPEAVEAIERVTYHRLVDMVHEALPLVAHATVDRVVKEVFEQMIQAYADGKLVDIKGFGKLVIKHRPARVGRNPATGEPVDVPAKVVPRFTFAKRLKDLVV